MTARTTVEVGTLTSPTPVAATPTGRLAVAGQTERGPLTAAVVHGMADYRSRFGDRTGGPDMYDAAHLYFAEGGGELLVARAAGPAAAAAARSLDSGKIVVTAAGVGAYGNAVTCAWTAATDTLTVVADGVTETYTGADAQTLLAAAAASPSVVVTSNGTLPAADVASGALAGGTDDYANTNWGTVLAAFTSDWGAIAVAAPGRDYGEAGEALGAHCAAAPGRLGLLTVPTGTTPAQAVTAAGVVAGYDGAEHLVLLWPDAVTTPAGNIPPVGFAAACRAAAHAANGPGEPPWSIDYGVARWATGPSVQCTEDERYAMDAARVSVVRTQFRQTRLYGWHTVAPFPGNTLLDEASQRDLVDAISHEAARITSRFEGRLTNPVRIAQWNSELTGMLAGHAATGALVGPPPDTVPDGAVPDPGYAVSTGSDVNSPTDIASGNVHARLAIRLAGSFEYITVTIAAADAAVAAF